MLRTASIALAAALSAVAGAQATNASAQEAIPTAAGASAAPAPAASAAPITLPESIDEDDAGPLPVGPCGAVAEVKDGQVQKPDRKPHGAVWAGVGTRGYREAGGVVCQPIGDHSAVTIAVDAGRLGGR